MAPTCAVLDDGHLYGVDRILDGWRRNVPRRRLPPVLGQDGHVIIIGAGPAGVFSAHFLRQLAREVGLHLRLTVFDAKDFTRSGPPGCNMCAGVVGGSLLRRMDECGLSVPPCVVQNRVNGFHLITRTGAFRLRREGPENTMVTVFRGNGPRPSLDTPVANVSFDDAVLRAVAGPDLAVIREPVTDIHLPQRRDDPISVSYGRGEPKDRMEAEVVVGAFGADSRLGRRLAEGGAGYRSPRTVRACQAELRVGRDHIEDRLHGEIQVLNLGLPGIAFAALVPKGDFLTCTMVGYRDVGLEDVLDLLDHPRVRARLPRGWRIPTPFCHCHPSTVISHAVRPFADRLVMVGDAVCCRYFKNGMETAFDTAALAAYTITHIGLSAQAFSDYFTAACEHLIERDNRFGRALFRANRWIACRPRIARPLLLLCRGPRGNPVSGHAQEALWGLFAGDRPYRDILREVFHPRVVSAAARMLLTHNLARRARGRRPLARRPGC